MGALRIETTDGIRTITIDLPDRLNALSFAALDELREALLEAAGQCGAVVVTGAGRAFSAGADLAAATASEDSLEYMRHGMNASVPELCEAMVASPIPVVAAVNGACVGGAVGLALLADVTLAGRSAYFVLPQVARVGIVPDMGATWLLPRRIGRGRALGAALLGDRISAEQAELWGMVWRCVDDELLLAEAQRTAVELARLDPELVRTTRQLVGGPDSSLLDQVRAEGEAVLDRFMQGAVDLRIPRE